MNGKDIFLGLKYVGDDLIHKAEYGSFNAVTGTEEKTAGPRRMLRRPLLIAAVIMLALLLVGCAVAYALRLQDMSIGKGTYTQYFDDEGRAIDPVEKPMDILSLYGHNGDNIQKATAEWFSFLETYDPDGELSDNYPDHADIPNRYEYTYGCYTPEMAAKVDEIAQKYGLKLLDEWLPFQAWQSDIFLEETGIGSLVAADSCAEMTRLSGMFYPPYNFDVDIEVSVEGMESDVWLTVLFARKDYFPRDYPGGTDLSLYEQWDYTAPDGTALLLALSEKGHGYVIADLGDAMMILSVDGNYSTSAYPTADDLMTREELEKVASVINWTIKPQILDRSVVGKRLDQSNAAYEAEHSYDPVTFGSFSDVMTSQYIVPNEMARYTFFDLTGDGADELLISFSGNGAIDEWYTVQDGEVQFFFCNSTYLCEGRVLERYLPDPELDDYVHHYYLEADSETAWMDLDYESEGDWLFVLLLTDGQWTYAPELHSDEEREITAEEAKSYMEQYPRIQLDWNSVMDYPISEDQTLREYLEEKDVRVPRDELMQIYKDKLNSMQDMYYSHYRILDINGDGVEDLLLKGKNDPIIGNTDYYWTAITYRYGHIVGLASDFYLCEGSVIERVSTRHAGGFGVEIDGHQYLLCNDLDIVILDFVAYNKATASWQGDWWNEVPLTEAEAEQILDRYPRMDQGMRPISEFLG